LKIVETPEPKKNVYSWVATMARLLPDATFAHGARTRDGKARVCVTHNEVTVEAVTDEDDPRDVVKLLSDEETRG